MYMYMSTCEQRSCSTCTCPHVNKGHIRTCMYMSTCEQRSHTCMYMSICEQRSHTCMYMPTCEQRSHTCMYMSTCEQRSHTCMYMPGELCSLACSHVYLYLSLAKVCGEIHQAQGTGVSLELPGTDEPRCQVGGPCWTNG